MFRMALFIIVISGISYSKPQAFNTLSAKFPSGKLVHKCSTCHSSSGPGLNPFGQDYHGVILQPNNIKFPGVATATLDQKWDFFLNKLDSNKNGKSNFQDIMDGRNPGK